MELEQTQPGYLDEFAIINSTIEGNTEIAEYSKNGMKYVLSVEVKDGQRSGKGVLKDEDGGVIADLDFENNQITGWVVLRNDQYQIIFKGMMLNGRKQGKCIEYDENGRVVFHGYYDENGNPHRLFEECKGKPGYYYEYSEDDGRLLSLSEYSIVGETKHGICYHYNDKGKVIKVSHFSQGVEERLYCIIDDEGMLREFDEGGQLVFKSTLSKVETVRICNEIDLHVLRGEELNDEVEPVPKLIPDRCKKGFWFEHLKNEMISSSQYTEILQSGNQTEECQNMREKNGISFDFVEGKCVRESMFVNGELQYVLREFRLKDKRDVMIEYNENRDKVYEGEYVGDYVNGFVYEGKGKQYLNGEIIFDGHFVSGKREGYGITFVNGYPRYRGEWHENHPHGKGEVVMSCVDDKQSEVVECSWKNGYGYDSKRESVIDMNGNTVNIFQFIRIKVRGIITWLTKKSFTNHILLIIGLILCFALFGCIGIQSSKKHQIIRHYSDYEELSWLDRYLVQDIVFMTDCCNSIATDIEIKGI